MLTSSRYFKGAVASAAALRILWANNFKGVCVIENFVWEEKRSWDFAHVQVGHLNLPNWQTKNCLIWKWSNPLTMDNGPLFPTKFCQNFAIFINKSLLSYIMLQHILIHQNCIFTKDWLLSFFPGIQDINKY